MKTDEHDSWNELTPLDKKMFKIMGLVIIVVAYGLPILFLIGLAFIILKVSSLL